MKQKKDRTDSYTQDLDNVIEVQGNDVIPELSEYIVIIDRVMSRWPFYQEQFHSELIQYKDIDKAYENLDKILEIYDIILDILENKRKIKQESKYNWRATTLVWKAIRLLTSQLKDLKHSKKILDFKRILVILKRSAKTIGTLRSNMIRMMHFGLDIVDSIKEEEKDEKTITPVEEMITEVVAISSNVEDEENTQSNQEYSNKAFHEILNEWNEEYDMIDHGRITKPIDLRKYPTLHEGLITEVAVDVARYGEDRTVIGISQNGHTVDIRSYAKTDTMETTGYVVRAIEDYDAKVVKVETTGGLGAAIVDRLKELGISKRCKIIALEVQGSPTKKGDKLKAFNLRAELYLNLEERLRLGEFTLPPDEEVAQDIAHITYRMLSNGRIMIDDKDIIRKRLGRSPDKGDAIAMLAWRSVAPKIY